MKQIIMILLIIGLVSGIQPKKFEVTYTVKYNAITLERASDLEKMFRELYKDACKVDVVIKESQGGMFFVDSISVVPMNDINLWLNSDTISVDTTGIMLFRDSCVPNLTAQPTLIFE